MLNDFQSFGILFFLPTQILSEDRLDDAFSDNSTSDGQQNDDAQMSDEGRRMVPGYQDNSNLSSLV